MPLLVGGVDPPGAAPCPSLRAPASTPATPSREAGASEYVGTGRRLLRVVSEGGAKYFSYPPQPGDVCTEVPPDSRYTCNQQAKFAACGQASNAAAPLACLFSRPRLVLVLLGLLGCLVMVHTSRACLRWHPLTPPPSPPCYPPPAPPSPS
jgi:hypothetical protein